MLYSHPVGDKKRICVRFAIKTVEEYSINKQMVNEIRDGMDISGAVIDFCLCLITKSHPNATFVDSFTIESSFEMGKFTGQISSNLRGIQDAKYDCVLIPINFQRGHWSLLVVDLTHSRILSYDSNRSKDSEGQESVILQEIVKFVHAWIGKVLETSMPKSPRQKLNDCGPCLLKNAINWLGRTTEDPEISYDTGAVREDIINMIESAPYPWTVREENIDSDVELL